MSVVLLALVADDKDAPRVLAAWMTRGHRRDEDRVEVSRSIARLLEMEITKVSRTLERCDAACLLLDGDISEVGKKWIESQLAQQLRGSGGKKRT